MKEHKLEYDILRIIAIILVIFNHTGTNGYFLYSEFFDSDTLNEVSWQYWVYMIPSIICKIAVPCFFMISGALLLGKDEPIIVIWKKRIRRIFIVLLFISLFYYLVGTNYSDLNVSEFFKLLYSEGVTLPLWFLYAYISFLIMLPFLRSIAIKLSRNMVLYLLGLAIIFQGIIPMVQYYASGGSLSLHGSLTISALLGTNVLYPLLGFCFSKYELSQKENILLAITGIITLIPVALLTNFKMKATGVSSYVHENEVVSFWGCFRVILVVTVFTGVCQNIKKLQFGKRAKTVITEIGSCVFGIYLIEDYIRNGYWFCYNYLRKLIPPYAAIWVYVLIVFSLSLGIVFVLRKIPVIRKYI